MADTDLSTSVNVKPIPKTKFSGKRKSALLLVSMGAEYAAKIYKHLKPDEIEQLTVEIAMLPPNIDPQDMGNVLSEFYEMCLAHKFIGEGGMDYATEVLERAFGVSNAREIIDKVLGTIGQQSFDFMKKVDPKQLFNFIQHEYPQTIALILSYATRVQASTIISLLPPTKQVEVVKRIAQMDRTSPDMIAQVEESLRSRLSTLGAREVTDIGGIKYTADLLNSVDRTTEKYIFDELGRDNPELAMDIRKLMFVFEDIVMLHDDAMQRLMKDVDSKDVVIALKSASEEIQNAFFRNMSKRSVETVQEDMQYIRNLRTKDVQDAQTRIVNKIRELEENGDIVISRGEDDGFV